MSVGKAWFPNFRFYGPTGPFFDQNWKLPEIEKADFSNGGDLVNDYCEIVFICRNIEKPIPRNTHRKQTTFERSQMLVESFCGSLNGVCGFLFRSV